MINNYQIVGITWRDHLQEDIEKISLNEDQALKALQLLKKKYQVEECAYLKTCNRIELFVYSEDLSIHKNIRIIWHEIIGEFGIAKSESIQFRSWRGEGAFEHLFMVASGLDSASLGESEILYQLKNAKEFSQKNHLIASEINFLFEESFKVAAQIKSNTLLNSGKQSLSEIAINIFTKSNLSGKDLNIGLIGTSPVIINALKSLLERGFKPTLMNRTLKNIKDLQDKYPIQMISLKDLNAGNHHFDVILSATSATEEIINEESLKAIFTNQTKIYIDLASTPDVSSDVCKRNHINYYSLDDVIEKAKYTHQTRQAEVANAREIIDSYLINLNQKINDKKYNSIYSAIQKRYQYTASEGIKRLIKKNALKLDQDAMNEIDIWCSALARRFAHIPTLGIKGLLNNGPDGSVEAFIEGLDEKFKTELKLAILETKGGNLD